jgi:hypothetical protein
LNSAKNKAERQLFAIAQQRAVRPSAETVKNIEIKQLHELREHEVQK